MSDTPSSSGDLTRVVLSVLSIGVLIVGSLWVLSPFVASLVWATTIVVATWPILIKLEARLGGRRGAAVAVMTIALLLVVFVPLVLALSTILRQSDRIVELARGLPAFQLPHPPSWVEGLPVIGPKLSERWLQLSALAPDELAASLAPYVKTALAWFAARAGTFGSMLVHFLLTVALAAILYSRGEEAAEKLRRFSRRLAGANGDAIVTLSGQAIRAVALGIVVTALLQTVLAGIGLYAVGMPLAGLVTAVVLVLCIAQLGPLLALVPCVIWLYAAGSPGRATGLLVVTVVAQAIDNVVRPLLIKKGADLSLLLIFPGVIGGLLWLGIIGLFIGPVILAVTSTLLESWMSVGETEPEGAPTVAAGARQTVPHKPGE